MPLLFTFLCHENVSTRWFVKKGNEFYSRDSTLRLAPQVVLKSSWQTQQQQQQQQNTSESASARSWKQNCEKDSSVEEKPEFKIRPQNWRNRSRCDLEGWRANEPNTRSSGKLRKGPYPKSIRGDLRKPGNSVIFSEESRRIIHSLGNIELYELGQMSCTIQCHSCFWHMPEGLKFCICGMRLRPDEDTIRKYQARFQTLIVPHYFARSRGKKCGESQWQKDQWKAVDATREANNKCHINNTIKWQEDEKYRESQLAHGWTV